MAREQRPPDRRIQKTRKLLHEALGSLIREKPYDEIVVKEILDRANVGRSTFYTHFKDKDELLAAGIHDMLQAVHSAELPTSGKKHEHLIRFSRVQHDELLQMTAVRTYISRTEQPSGGNLALHREASCKLRRRGTAR